MSYVNGYSEASIVANISTAVSAGYPRDVAVASALSTARSAWRRAHPKGPYPAHLRGMRAPHKRRKASRTRSAGTRRNRSVSATVKRYEVHRVRLNRGGYTSRGEYFGVGQPLFEVTDNEERTHLYVRAPNAKIARAAALADLSRFRLIASR